ncbi:hypothetical protein D3C78_451590 [compost metagenome]
MHPVEWQQQQFQANQREQQRVEHVVDQFPEAVHVATGHVVHCQVAPQVADDQPGHHHGDRRRNVQLVAHRRATDDQRQGQHHFHLILLDAFDHAVGGVADQAAEHHAADGLAGEQDRGVGHARRLAQLDDAQQHGEHHHRSAVVEQRLADDSGFQRFGGIGGT